MSFFGNIFTTSPLPALTKSLGKALQDRKFKVSTAESLTGGGAAYWLTRYPGSSEWFDRGFVTYTIEAKQELLHIDPELIKKYDVVSEIIAKEMASKALQHSHSQVSVSFTGVAGPSGGTPQHPVGTVWIGWAGKSFETHAEAFLFKGDRDSVLNQSIVMGFKKLIKLLNYSTNVPNALVAGN